MHPDWGSGEPGPVTFDIWAERGITCGEILEERGMDSAYFVDLDGEMASEYLYIRWDYGQIEEGLASGANEFTVTGEYISSPDWDWSEEFRVMWEEGRIQVPEEFTPKLTVHLRPDDLVTTYVQSETYAVREITVRKSVPFEDAIPVKTEWLRQEQSPYEETYCEFAVTWNRDEFESGMESGADAFIVSGRYGACVDQEYRKLQEQGFIRADENAAPKIKVCVQGRPEIPLVYQDLFSGPYYVLASGSDSFASLNLPETKALSLEGTNPFANMREFAVRWNREEFRAGIASGSESFVVNGTFVPDLLDREEREWWEEGCIRLDKEIVQPTAVVTVVKGSRIPFQVTLKPMDAEETKFFPVFKFPGLANAEQVICAYSLDKRTWYEYEVEDYEWKRYDKDISVIIPFTDEDGNFMSISPEETAYFKIMVKGSSMEGETDLCVLNEPEQGGNRQDTPVIDNGDPNVGDRGGGGQGEHDRGSGQEEEPKGGGADQKQQEGVVWEEGNHPETQRAEEEASSILHGNTGGGSWETQERPVGKTPERIRNGVLSGEDDKGQEILQTEETEKAGSGAKQYKTPEGNYAAEGRQEKAGIGSGGISRLPGYALGAVGTAVFLCIGAAWVCKKNKK